MSIALGRHIISAHDAPHCYTALGLRDTIPTGKCYAPPVTTKAAFPDMVLTGDCNPLEDADGNWLRDRDAKPLCGQMVQQYRYNRLLGSRVLHADAAQHKCDLFPVFKTATGRLVTIEAPDLVQPADEAPAFEFGGVFTAFADGGMYLTDPTTVSDPYLGFSDEDMDTVVWVEGQQFGIESAPEVSILAEMLPAFSFSGEGKDVRATCNANLTYFDANKQRFVTRACTCDISYREFAITSADRDGTDRANMEAFVLALAEHSTDWHPHVTSEMMCEHGERNFVQSRSRNTGQKFSAAFCKRGQSNTACDPVWFNTL